MRIPIACSLAPSEARGQLGEWHDLVSRLVTEVQRSSPDCLRLELPADPAALPEVVALAQREQACCPFFTFTVEIEAHRLRLAVRVPGDATSVLDDLLAPNGEASGRTGAPREASTRGPGDGSSR